MKQRIKIEERHIADLWRLPCVTGIVKNPTTVIVRNKGPHFFGLEGDYIVENDDHTWSVEKGGEENENSKS